jgi:hypothetical protein
MPNIHLNEYFNYLESRRYVREYHNTFLHDTRQRISLCIDIPTPRSNLFCPGERQRVCPPHALSSVIKRRFYALGFLAEGRGNARYVLRDHPGVDIDLACFRNNFLPYLASVRSGRGASSAERFLTRLDRMTPFDIRFERQLASYMTPTNVTDANRDLWDFYNDFYSWHLRTYQYPALRR